MTDTGTVYYLAYGSNLHPLRLQLRLPGSRLLARVTLPACRLCFHKRGRDGSGKCNLVIVPGERSYGALYHLQAGEQKALDAWEGGYDRHWVHLIMEEKAIQAVTYLAPLSVQDERLEPFEWYRALVQAGAEHLGCPPDYLDRLEAFRGRDDPDPQRAALHQRLVTQLQEFNGLPPRPGLKHATLVGWP